MRPNAGHPSHASTAIDASIRVAPGWGLGSIDRTSELGPERRCPSVRRSHPTIESSFRRKQGTIPSRSGLRGRPDHSHHSSVGLVRRDVRRLERILRQIEPLIMRSLGGVRWRVMVDGLPRVLARACESEKGQGGFGSHACQAAIGAPRAGCGRVPRVATIARVIRPAT